MSADAPLSPSQREQFAQLLARGLDQHEAYRKSGIGALGVPLPAAIDTEINARAEYLAAQPDAPEYQLPALDARDMTREQLMAAMLVDHRKAFDNGQMSAAVRAMELIGKLSGFFEERPATAVVENKIAVIIVPEKVAQQPNDAFNGHAVAKTKSFALTRPNGSC